MKNHKHIAVFVLIIGIIISMLFLSFLQPSEEQQEFKASYNIEHITDTIVSSAGRIIRFKTSNTALENEVHLILSGTYGTIVLTPDTSSWETFFSIPPAFTQRAGVVHYFLVQKEQTIQEGTFTLLPNTQELGGVSTYLGPRSIMANERDYTMLVSIPTDKLDNMLPDSTAVHLKTQFKNVITTTNHKLGAGFVWKRIPAPLQTGRISTGSTIKDVSSSELVADIFPDLAQDFTITSTSNHNYADGNEIITFKTSQIKDIHGNTITDGTLVTFSITDSSGSYWQVNATTVNGFAFAKALHPQSPGDWTVRAAITGIAQSDILKVTFMPIIEKIPFTISKDNRNISVGPLTSYLGQLVQDGIEVSLSVNKFDYKTTQLSQDGMVNFYISKEAYPDGPGRIILEALGSSSIIKAVLN